MLASSQKNPSKCCSSHLRSPHDLALDALAGTAAITFWHAVQYLDQLHAKLLLHTVCVVMVIRHFASDISNLKAILPQSHQCEVRWYTMQSCALCIYGAFAMHSCSCKQACKLCEAFCPQSHVLEGLLYQHEQHSKYWPLYDHFAVVNAAEGWRAHSHLACWMRRSMKMGPASKMLLHLLAMAASPIRWEEPVYCSLLLQWPALKLWHE